jgi:hypothetical protein
MYGFLGMGISTFFEILGHFMFQGDGTTLYGQDLYTIKRNKNMYSLRVGISTVFEHLWF